jgi:hypothetical protein
MNKKIDLKIGLVIGIIGLLLVSLSPVVVQGQGQGSITISNSTATVNYPLTLNFSSQVKSNSNITDVRLRYKVEQMSYADVTSEGFVDLTPSTTVNAKWSLDMRRIGGLPPGSLVDYWWAARNAAGNQVETSPVQYRFNDTRYKWQNISSDKVTIFWYNGTAAFAQELMNTAQQSLVKLAKDTGAAPDKMVNIYIYASAQDLQGAMVFPQEWTGGVAFTQYSIVAIGISPSNLAWGKGAMTHELTHIVVYQVIYNPYNDLPVWLNEGLAMYSEGPLDSQFTAPLKSAIQNKKLLSVRTICSPFSAFADRSVLSYAESYTLIAYLTSQYGADKMLELLKTFKQGSSYDAAFQTVYGFNLDGLDSQWRTWVSAQYK